MCKYKSMGQIWSDNYRNSTKVLDRLKAKAIILVVGKFHPDKYHRLIFGRLFALSRSFKTRARTFQTSIGNCGVSLRRRGLRPLAVLIYVQLTYGGP